MPDRLRFGILGAAWIADRAILPAMQAASNAMPTAIASRDPARARAMGARHGVAVAHETYDALLADSDVDAVYIGLVNSAHHEWAVRALRAGKHVLCEKPLALTGAEARAMAAAAGGANRVLMEALMYRFHPRMRALAGSARDVRFAHAAFSFRLAAADNYRRDAALGGGALLDVGCYTLDAVRWLLGEATQVRAVMEHRDGVDVSVAASLGFAGGAEATTWASFEAPEHQVLEVVCGDVVRRVETPFTAWRDPDDPYQLMIEAFADAVLSGSPPPRPLADSIATADLVDRVRAAAAAA